MNRIEQQHHIAIVEYLRTVLPSHWHVVHYPSGGFRTPFEARTFKRMGVVPGFPDIMIMGEDARGPRCWFAEVKAPKGTASIYQRQFHESLRNLGFQVAVIHNIDEARTAAEMWKLPMREKIISQLA